MANAGDVTYCNLLEVIEMAHHPSTSSAAMVDSQWRRGRQQVDDWAFRGGETVPVVAVMVLDTIASL
jgi:hypothetical protein